MNAVARDIEYAATAVRAANHSTMRGGLDGPETGAVVENLVDLVQRLPQVLDFLVRSLRRADPTAHDDDRGRDPADALAVAGAQVLDARDLLDAVRDHLDNAHQQLGHLGRRMED